MSACHHMCVSFAAGLVPAEPEQERPLLVVMQLHERRTCPPFWMRNNFDIKYAFGRDARAFLILLVISMAFWKESAPPCSCKRDPIWRSNSRGADLLLRSLVLFLFLFFSSGLPWLHSVKRCLCSMWCLCNCCPRVQRLSCTPTHTDKHPRLRLSKVSK